MKGVLERLEAYSLSRTLYDSNVLPKEPELDTKRLNNNMYFWIYYLSKYGSDAKMDFTNESNEKFKQIEEVRKNTHILKEIKYKRESFEEDLMYSKNISESTLKVLCIMNNISILIIKNKCYYFFDYGTITNLLENSTCTFNIKNVNEIQRKYYLVDSKPLNSISYYKLPELQDIATRLGIEVYVGSKSRLKKVIYDEILIKLIQMI